MSPAYDHVSGHFIDEKRRRRLAVASGVGKILLAEAAQVGGTQIRDRLDKRGLAIRLGSAASFTRAICGKSGQLHGAFNRRVARDNLFEQGADKPAAKPMMKIGSADGAPDLRAAKNSALYCRLQRLT